MNEKYMNLAFLEAKKAFSNDEVPIGAVIVKNDKVLAKSYNKKEKNNCSLYHAELNCIKSASKKLKNWRLDDCDIYITLDPCPMCASAIKQSRIKNVYSACNNSDSNNEMLIKKIFESDLTNSGVNFHSNLDVIQSKKILHEFFELKRKK